MSSPVPHLPNGAAGFAPRDSNRIVDETDGGFTLIEILVVVMLMGLLGSIVTTNMSAFLPESALDGESRKVRSWIDYLRSESKVQGKPYSLELDLDNHVYRLVLPTEDKLVTTEDDTLASTIPLNWTAVGKGVKFFGHSIAGREVYNKGKIKITFDENGFSADQSLYFREDRHDPQLVWTIHIYGLSGTTKSVENREGTRAVFRATEESDF